MEAGFNCLSEELKGRSILLSAGFDDGEHPFEKTAAGGALGAEAQLALIYGGTQRTFGRVLGLFFASDKEWPRATAPLFSQMRLKIDQKNWCQFDTEVSKLDSEKKN